MYNDNILESGWGSRLQRSGTPGEYRYEVEPECADRPIVLVSFWNACRFCNWLHNGQGDGDTETGAYTLNGRRDDDQGTVARNPDARWFVPSEDEWHKAAYYDPATPAGPGYWTYPTRHDAPPTRDLGGANAANINTGALLSPVTTPVGSFDHARSAYGTLDQGGNVSEWTESAVCVGSRWLRRQRGGSFLFGSEDLRASHRDEAPPQSTERLVGFRVAGAAMDAHGRLVVATGAMRPPTVEADAQGAVVQRNAALAARLCREAHLKGFMLDTEQYDRYTAAAGGHPYPVGKDDPELVRRRGRQWIEAVQAEYPEITIIIFIA